MIKKRESYFIGMDISINGPGIVVLDRHKKVIDFRKYDYKKRSGYIVKSPDGEYTLEVKTSDHRALVFVQDVLIMITKYKGSIIGIEGYNYNGEGLVFNIAEFTGYLKNELLRCKIVIDKIIPPTSIKMLISGHGGASKLGIEKSLEQRYGLNFHDEDLNDACAIAVILVDNLYSD